MATKRAHQGGIPTDLQAAEAEPVAIDKLIPAVEVYKTTFALNSDRSAKAVAYGKTIALKPGEVILSETEDDKARVFLQRCKNTLEGEKEGVNGQQPREGIIETRKTSTRILDSAKAWAMQPEKELLAEMERIKRLRDERATFLFEEERKEQQEIARQKAYEMYRNKVKAEMNARYMLKVKEKLDQLYTAISGMFAAATLENVEKLTTQLNIKPGLKPEAFRAMLDVPYDQHIMSTDQYEELVNKAYAYFDFEKVNASYMEMANKIITDWRGKIDEKRMELQRIAKGGADAERAKQQAEANKAQAAADKAAEDQRALQEIQNKALATQQEEDLKTEFESQVREQSIEGTNGKKVKVFRFAPSVESDPHAFAKAMGTIMLNVLMNTETGMTASAGMGAIFKKDKLDENGRRVYIDAVQHWLDKFSGVAYANNTTVAGVVMEEKISTSTRA